MLDSLEKISDVTYELMKNKFEYVLEALATSQNVRKENLTKDFENPTGGTVIVIGFNSSSYDLNLIKPVIIQ